METGASNEMGGLHYVLCWRGGVMKVSTMTSCYTDLSSALAYTGKKEGSIRGEIKRINVGN